MKQEFKNYLLDNGFIQGGSKSTENNFWKSSTEIVINGNSFEYRKIVAGNVSTRTQYHNPEFELLKQLVSQIKNKPLVPKSKANDKKAVA